MSVIVRFPPSPTGFLHIGNARAALINYLFAKKNGGKLILRFDDTDGERCKDEFKTRMLEDLEWLGISFDEKYEQSTREVIYRDVLQKLLKSGRVYECFETEEELEIKRKLANSRGLPPIYDRASLGFTADQKNGREIYYRFKLNHEEIRWTDLIQGEIKYNGKDLSDPVILRANGNFMYTFCSVVDDYMMSVSHVLRGADHITNTAIQVQIYDAIEAIFGKKTIQFGHYPLYTSKEGKISKRVGGFSIIELHKAGIDPLAIKNAIFCVGLSYFDNNLKTDDEMISRVDLGDFNKAQIMFDVDLIEHFNAQCIQKYTFLQLKSRIIEINSMAPAIRIPDISEDFFEIIRENLSNLFEIIEWNNAIQLEGSFLSKLSPEDSAFALAAFGFFNKDWSVWLTEIKKNFPDRKGKNIFVPLRIAITGCEHGPEMAKIVSIMPNKVLQSRFVS